MRQHYLDSDPWGGVPDRAPVDTRIQIDKALPIALLQQLWHWLEEQSAGEGAGAAQMRVVRAEAGSDARFGSAPVGSVRRDARS